jgi:hypothetical protein
MNIKEKLGMLFIVAATVFFILLGLESCGQTRISSIEYTSLRDLCEVEENDKFPIESAMSVYYDVKREDLINSPKTTANMVKSFIYQAELKGYKFKKTDNYFCPDCYILDALVYFDKNGYILHRKDIESKLTGNSGMPSEIIGVHEEKITFGHDID